MNLSQEASGILQQAVKYAGDNKYVRQGIRYGGGHHKGLYRSRGDFTGSHHETGGCIRRRQKWMKRKRMGIRHREMPL